MQHFTKLNNKIIIQNDDKFTRAYKIDTNSPIYSGLIGENLDEWIQVIVNNFEASGVPDNRRLDVVTNYTAANAKSILLKYQRDNPDRSKRSFKEYFILLAL